MSVTVITDNSWDNYAKIIRRINKKSLMNEKINFFYGKNMKFINDLCTKNNLNIFRRSLSDKNFNENVKDVLMYTKFCIIFHNFIETCTLSSYVIEICKCNNIPYFIFSDNCDEFYYNGEHITTRKFKNCVKEIEFNIREIKVIPDYCPIFCKKHSEKDERDSINFFCKTYQKIQTSKKLNRIIYIN